MACDSVDLRNKLNACGLPIYSEGGVEYVDLAFGYAVTISIPAGDVVPVLLYDQEIVIREGAEFWLRRIRTTDTTGSLVYWRWGIPGRWMMSDRAEMVTSLGSGSNGKAVQQQRIPPGGKILYEIESRAGTPLDFQLVFDGVERIYL